jgi:hypothetical protein
MQRSKSKACALIEKQLDYGERDLHKEYIL